MIRRLLVANRAEIASRVFRTCRARGIATVAVHSDADTGLPYVAEADLAVRLPGDTPAETYLRADLLVDAALRTGADAVHPGYGFLAEDAGFARAVVAAGLTWVGPDPEAIEQMGSKVRAKQLMREAGVPVLEAPEVPTEADLPLLVKASAGGGGRGMRVVRDLADLAAETAAARDEAAAAFGDGTVFVEPYVEHGRHVEVQVWADGHRTVSVLGDRDCSLQRRHQKVVEEAPAPGRITPGTRAAMHRAARDAAVAIGYRGVGTVELLLDEAAERFFFLEMNTRLQVEHPVTEMVTGLDLVDLQLRAAEGGPAEALVVEPRGHAVEARLYAEDPLADYRPQSGRLTAFEIETAADVRVEAGYAAGDVVTTHYDAMLAKVVAHAPSRAAAARRLAGVLRRARVHGVRTNRDQLVGLLEEPDFLDERLTTRFLDEHPPRAVPPDPHAAAAAALALAEHAAARRPVQRGVATGWRSVVSGPRSTRFTDDAGGEEVGVLWHGTRDGHVVDGEAAPRVLSVTAEAVTLDADGVRATYRTRVTGLPDRETVDVDGPHGHARLTRVPRFVDPTERAAPGSLVAPMPGTVVRVDVAEGEEVEAGSPVLVLEAMKMRHTVAAPSAGVVERLAVEVGTQVSSGEVLAVVAAPRGESTDGSGAAPTGADHRR